MADNVGNIKAKDYSVNVKQTSKQFFLKGSDSLDWGMKNRLSRIFNPTTGKTVMLAFDHGYIMGSTSGLERLDIVIPPLVDDVDVLMATRGALRSCISPAFDKAIALRSSAGSSVIRDDMSNEILAVDIEDAIRMNASCVAVQLFIGSDNECRSIENLNNAVNMGLRYSMPTMGVVAVGKEMERTSKYFLLATRMIAEFGANLVKTYYCEDFEKVVAACPVPIVIAGGKKLPEAEALEMCYKAIDQGAAGVDMGRNIFQSENPLAMTKAIKAVVHENLNGKRAYEMYLDLSKKK